MKKLHYLLPLVLATAVWACDPNENNPENNGGTDNNGQEVVTPGDDNGNTGDTGDNGDTGQTGGYTYERTMSVCEVIYYGNEYSTNTENWLIYLMDNPSTEDGYGTGVSYQFDVYGTAGSNVMPSDGTYSYGANVETNWTIGDEYSAIVTVDSYGSQTVQYIDECTLTVSHSGSTYTFVAELTDETGATHKVTYTGAYDLYDGRTSDSDSDYVTSTLTGDYEVDMTGFTGTALYYGDYLDNGTNNWLLYLDTPDTVGESVQIDIYAGSTSTYSSGVPTGTFTVADTYAAGTIAPAYFDGQYFSGGWFYLLDDGYVDLSMRAPFVGGSATISASGSTYTVSLNFTDENGYKITGSWTGTFRLYNESSSISASPLSKSSIPTRTGTRQVAARLLK